MDYLAILVHRTVYCLSFAGRVRDVRHCYETWSGFCSQLDVQYCDVRSAVAIARTCSHVHVQM